MDGIASFLAGTSDASHSSPRRLSQDPGEWAGEIVQLVSGMIPPEVPARPQVHFNQQDEINGFAVGSVHLSDTEGNVKAFVPLIVRRFLLKPLDIVVEGGKFSPFTEKRLREIFGSTDMDDGTIDMWKVRDGADQSLEQTNPSSAGLYPYAGAPMSREDFLQTLTARDQAELEAALSKEAAALGVLKAMDKVAAVHELMTPPTPVAAPDPVVSVRSFQKVAAGKYKVLTSFEGSFGPTVVETDENGLRVAIKDAVPEQKDEWLTRVHNDGSATLKSQEEDSEKNLAKEENINQGPRGGEVFLYRTDRVAPEDGTEHGGCFAMTTAGQRIRGVLLPKVVDLDGKSVNTKLFVGRSVAGVQPKIAIERISGKVDMQDEVEDAVPKKDDTGTLVHIDETGDTVALVPMTIDSLWSDQGGCFAGDNGKEPTGPRMTINARTMLGKRVELVVGRAKGIVDITPDHRKTEGKEPGRRRYAVSSEFKWVPMSEFKEFMTQPRLMRDADDLEKKASIPQLRVIYTGLGYGLQAPWVKTAQALFDKEAAPPGMLPRAAGANAAAAGAAGSPLPTPDAPSVSGGAAGMPKGASLDLSCLSEGEARHILCELGANVATADGVLKYAKVHGSLRVRGLEAPIEKLARHPLLAVPSKGKALRAALMGLGLGGAGLAAVGAASPGVRSEFAASASPHIDRAGDYLKDVGGHAVDVAGDVTGRDLRSDFRGMRDAAGQVADDLGVKASRGASDASEFIARGREDLGVRGGRALEDMRRSGARLMDSAAGRETPGTSDYENLKRQLGRGAEDLRRSGGRKVEDWQRGGGRMLQDLGIEKNMSANPALEMVDLLRGIGKSVFSKLAYAATVHYRRAGDEETEEARLAKLAQADETIEAALDLNFLNPQNISYFIGLQPKLQEVLDGLGRLLVAVRLGLPDVDEETVRSAVKQIDSILSGLRALSFAETDG